VIPRLLGRPTSDGDDAAQSRGHLVKRAAILAATAPLLRAGAAGSAFAVKAASAQRRGVQMFPDVPNPAPTVALAASVALDELLVLSMGVLGSLGSQSDYARSSAELDDAVRFYDTNGWLDDAAAYFEVPPAPREVDVEPVRSRRGPMSPARTSGPHMIAATRLLSGVGSRRSDFGSDSLIVSSAFGHMLAVPDSREQGGETAAELSHCHFCSAGALPSHQC